MISSEDLYFISKTRYEEAKILLAGNKPDGAVYLCGYAVELVLKRHIVKTLNWNGYPETNREFKKLKLNSFKVHDLDTLLLLAGLEKKIQSDTPRYAKWQIARSWNSEIRYKCVGELSKAEAKGIIEASRDILNYIVRL